MIELQTEQFAGVEALHAFPAGKHAQPLPCVVFYHGFTSSKLVYSYFAVALAQAGFRVIMPDAPDHGARFSGDAQHRLGQFWQILRGNIEEFAALRDALEHRELIAGQRLAVGGASMGGMTALGIMTHHPEVRCVASLMASGYFTTLAHTLFPRWRRQTSRGSMSLTRLSHRLPGGMSAPNLHALRIVRCCCGTASRMTWFRQPNLSVYSRLYKITGSTVI